MEETIISNRSWFQRYAIARGALIIAVILIALSKNLISPDVWSPLMYASVVLILVLLVFDYLQKPSLLEVVQHNDMVTLRQYRPDARYFSTVSNKKIQSMTCRPEHMAFKIYKSPISALNQIQFFINQPNSHPIKSDKINIAWLGDNGINALTNILKKVEA